MIKMYFALFIVLFASCVRSQTPILHRPPGYIYQPCSMPLVSVEVVYDHLCDDSKANWPILQSLKEAYPKDVEILIHIFPLPYHHNAYFVQQAGEVVKNASLEKFEKFIDIIFKNQDRFLTGAVNMTEPSVKSAIADLVQSDLEIQSSTVLSGFDDDVIVRRSRYAWKYAAHRGITGTPQFIVNGVHDPDAQSYNLDDWKKLIDGLIKAA